jgi:hypothetical protein
MGNYKKRICKRLLYKNKNNQKSKSKLSWIDHPEIKLWTIKEWIFDQGIKLIFLILVINRQLWNYQNLNKNKVMCKNGMNLKLRFKNMNLWKNIWQKVNFILFMSIWFTIKLLIRNGHYLLLMKPIKRWDWLAKDDYFISIFNILHIVFIQLFQN